MKLIYILLALILLATSVSAATLTTVTGNIIDGNSQPVNGATITATCTHLNIDTEQVVYTNSQGDYYAFFPAIQCDVGDTVVVHAQKDAQEGIDEGIVTFDNVCRINTAIISFMIPEFGIIAGSIALVGILSGAFIMRRKK